MQHTEDKTALNVDSVDAFKPKIDRGKKVKRHVAGQVPEAGADAMDVDEGFFAQHAAERGADPHGSDDVHGLGEGAYEDEDEPRVRRRRRERVEAEVIDDDQPSGGSGGGDEAGGGFVEGDVVEGDAAERMEEEAEDEEAIAARRARIRDRLRRRNAEAEEEEEEEEGFGAPEDEAEEEEAWPAGDADGEESEWETESDESDDETTLLKPVFVPKSKRGTIAELEAKAAQEEERERAQAEKLEKRKAETRNMVAEQIRRDEEQVENHVDGNDSDANMPSDTDDNEDPMAYEAWKVRELQRVKRDRDLRLVHEQEKAETERRRGLTDEQRAAEDAALGKNKVEDKGKWKFMQKYYHKGAFYMDETEMDDKDVRKREFDGATLDDKFDKQALPKVMQVKKFGFSGQTKYTHLKDQDTTDFDNPWNQKNQLRANYDSKMAGVGDIDSAGRKRKK